jgi:type 1 glutamine amidotransferase
MKGRVFNSVLGHRPEFYMMPDLVKLMVDADIDLLRRHRQGEIRVSS